MQASFEPAEFGAVDNGVCTRAHLESLGHHSQFKAWTFASKSTSSNRSKKSIHGKWKGIASEFENYVAKQDMLFQIRKGRCNLIVLVDYYMNSCDGL